MKARLVEDVNFERGQDPKEAMDIGMEKPTKKDIVYFLVDDENWDDVELFVNDLLDRIYNKYPVANSVLAMDAIKDVIRESLDNWYQTTQE